MPVKSQFSIKDLENLSGVKAHTIRIWEKRYNLLSPQRTETNIRTYDLASLKKLLNVTFLYNEGHKISKIAELSKNEIIDLVKEKAIPTNQEYVIKTLKTAMFDFDEALFLKTYDDYISERSFREIFFEVFMPLLVEIGTLWQTGTLEPSHESFVSEIVRRKIMINIDTAVRDLKKTGDTVFVLFLPYKEIHEIGLLYTNYELISAGYKTIYLGANIPLEGLDKLNKLSNNVIFVSYVTMLPEGKNIHDYIDNFQKTVSNKNSCDLWLLGGKAQLINQEDTSSNIKVLKNLTHLMDGLKELENK